MEKDTKRRPPWLVGLIWAILIFAAVLLAARLLGYGDEPALREGTRTVIGW